MNFAKSARAVFAGLVALSLAACGINSVPAAEEEAKAKWADVEAQFQRRANLIPNLAEVAQGAAENEQTILREVTETRNSESTKVNEEAKQAIIAAGGEVRTLTPEQRAAWVEAMKPVWDQFADDVGQENIDAAQAINASM